MFRNEGCAQIFRRPKLGQIRPLLVDQENKFRPIRAEFGRNWVGPTLAKLVATAAEIKQCRPGRDSLEPASSKFGQNSTEFDPKSRNNRVWTGGLPNRPKFSRIRPNRSSNSEDVGRIWAGVGRISPGIDQRGAEIAKLPSVGESRSGIQQLRAEFKRFGQGIGQSWPGAGRIWAEDGQIRPELDQSRATHPRARNDACAGTRIEEERSKQILGPSGQGPKPTS